MGDNLPATLLLLTAVGILVVLLVVLAAVVVLVLLATSSGLISLGEVVVLATPTTVHLVTTVVVLAGKQGTAVLALLGSGKVEESLGDRLDDVEGVADHEPGLETERAALVRDAAAGLGLLETAAGVGLEGVGEEEEAGERDHLDADKHVGETNVDVGPGERFTDLEGLGVGQDPEEYLRGRLLVK